ncbi:tryptophan--tRNA ligase, cytoplasmic-like isoform X1 [Brassica rapa]|uniref:tryptophan--tRNA ligase, cytoplasmic-like isoform X1 n=1 Tax=Brassica campestris TaxID=3711 RepID=UPI00142E6D5E|nr:tryptophan--tRNA ligase, cytoplasmic-like isoform X1 [Brassica rapa]
MIETMEEKAIQEIKQLLQLVDQKLSSIPSSPMKHDLIHEIKQWSDEKKESESMEQVVNPYEVSAKDGGKIDYDKIVEKFGCKRVDQSLIDRVHRLTSRDPHVFLRRGVFFAHRDFNEILDSFERGDKFYLYTGRGPSSEALHLGHLIPFMFTKYLQEAFKVPVVIQLTDDEKFMWSKTLKVEDTKRLARENIKDIIACGFDVEKTFIFSNIEHAGTFYENTLKIGKCVTVNKANAIFGFAGEDPVGKMGFPPVQAAPSFASSFQHLFLGKDNNLRCLIPCAIDQDPYFRMTRDVAPRLDYSKPALIESKFLPSLKGVNGKMSASNPNSAIYVTDTTKDIKKKVNSAFSGGKDNSTEQENAGADLEVDIPFKYLSFFLDDDAELEHIKKVDYITLASLALVFSSLHRTKNVHLCLNVFQEYGEGRMLSGPVKQRLTEVLTEVVEKHRKARAAVTDEMVNAFMAVRPLPKMFD